MKIMKNILLKNPKIIVLAVIVAFLSFANESFFTGSNLLNIIRQSSILTILAIGITAPILTGGIDLSLSGVMSLSGCVCAYFLDLGFPIIFAVSIALCLGMFFGLFNGTLVSFVGLPPFVATYGVSFIADGLALMIMGPTIFYGFPKVFQFLGVGFIWKIPILIVIAFVVVIIMYIVLQKTNFGKMVYCVGANPTASYYSGLSTKKIYLSVYLISSSCAAIGGILQVARMNAAQAGLGITFQMLAVASVVIGGTSMSGGEGSVIGGVVGALILILIVNGMNLLEIPPLAQSVVTGSVIILAVLLDLQLKKAKAK